MRLITSRFPVNMDIWIIRNEENCYKLMHIHKWRDMYMCNDFTDFRLTKEILNSVKNEKELILAMTAKSDKEFNVRKAFTSCLDDAIYNIIDDTEELIKSEIVVIEEEISDIKTILLDEYDFEARITFVAKNAYK